MRVIIQLAVFLGVAMVAGLAWAEDDGNWTMYNYDAAGSRANNQESTINVGNAANLHVQWGFPTAGLVTATPIVLDGVVYAGDATGAFYAINPDGTLKWQAQTYAAITASATIVGNRVVVGDLSGYVFGFKRNTGELAWTLHPVNHPLAGIWGSGTRVGSNIAIGVASNEEQAATVPGYPCCSTIGAVVLIDPVEGEIVWQANTITEAELNAGSSGASVWSSPTYDAQLGLVYVTTGNNFSDPSTPNSDAIIAIDAKSGAIVWSNQRYEDDVWNYTYPGTPEHPDFDFGDSPQVYKLSDGTKVVAAGQKSGFYHVLDAESGDEITVEQYVPGDTLGGFFSDSAVSGGVVYANGNWWPNPDAGGYPYRGDIVAISGDGTQELWRYSVSYSANLSGVTVANGVVYFASAFNGTLYALDASNGQLLKSFLIGAAESAPSVSNGHVYIGTGEFFTQAPDTPSHIYCLGL